MYTFAYERAASRDAAAAAHKGDARYLAGGQSLVQAMKLRLSSAEKLIDLSTIADLRGIKVEGGAVVIGAMTTHSEVAHSEAVKKAIPALAELAGGIGDQMVRNRGTIGGSIANADPAACYPSAIVALGATVHTNKRTIDGDSFFKGLYETALQAGELVTAVSFPIPEKAAYIKFKQPASRFALVGVFVSKGSKGTRVGVTGVKSSVYREAGLEQALAANFSAGAIANSTVSNAGINADLHGSAEYRAAMVVVMAQRAVTAANSR
jgi:aerobic carbon-monoxide dehydrogenase medium subunit